MRARGEGVGVETRSKEESPERKRYEKRRFDRQCVNVERRRDKTGAGRRRDFGGYREVTEVVGRTAGRNRKCNTTLSIEDPNYTPGVRTDYGVVLKYVEGS